MPGIVLSGSNAVTVFTVNSGVAATIDELTISNGLSPQQGSGTPSQGGGIRNFGTLTINACTIAHNQASGGSSDGGGGIANFGTLNMFNSTIADNTLGPSASATGNAGAGIANFGTLSLVNCTIADNDATPGNGNGGGIDIEGPTTLLNSILSGNLGVNSQNTSGGAITLASNDVLGNNVAGYLYQLNPPGSPNYAYEQPIFSESSGIPPSIVSGSDNTVGVDAVLDADLKNNGGPTPTLAEMVGSWSIGAGNPAFDTNLPFDQRGTGFPRVVNGRVDIGAFQTATPPIYFATGSDAGAATSVTIYSSAGSFLGTFDPWGTGFTGGARVATGDVNGDGVPDLIVGSGPGGATAVLVYDGNSVNSNPSNPTLIAAFFPFGPQFSGGCFVAAGNLDGGPSDEISVSADSGGGPQVNVYSAAQIQAGNFSNPSLAFYAYAPSFTGGVRLAVGDLNGDGKADLITAPGPGGGPQINVFLGTSNGFLTGPVLAFDAFVPSFTGGAYVTAMDINGNGKAALFVGAGLGTSQVNLYSADQLLAATPYLTPRTAFYAPDTAIGGQPAVPGGVRLGATVGLLNGTEVGPLLLTSGGSDFNPTVDEFDARGLFNNPGSPPTSVLSFFGAFKNGYFVSVT